MSTEQEIALRAERARAAKDEMDPGRSLTLREMFERPSFSGFVSASPVAGISFVMFVAEQDDLVALRLFWNGTYEATSLKLWCALAKDAQSVLDIGAHSGIFTLAALEAGASKVYAFEPHPSAFARLVVNVRANQFASSRLSIHNYAVVASDDAEVDMYVGAPIWAIPSGSSIARKTSDSIKVKAINLMALAHKTQPNLIKIDTEGAEAFLMPLLANADRNHPQDILVEISQVIEGGVVDALLSRGYKIHRLMEERGDIVPVERFESASMPDTSEKQDGMNYWLTLRPESEIEDILSAC